MPAHRLFSLALAVALFFAFASTAFAARAYDSQITQANSTALVNPVAVAADSSDNVWVSDTGTHTVSKFDSTGAYLAQNDGTGSWGANPYTLGIAWGDSAGLLYAADSNFGDLWGLNPDTTYASVDLNSGLGGGCCFIRAAVDNSGGANDGDIYVAVGSPTSHIVRIDGTGAASNFSASASYITGNEIIGAPPSNSFFSLGGIAVGPNGDVYVVEAGSAHTIDRFDSTGAFVASYTGTFGSLTEIAIDPSNGNILVVDGEQGVIHELDSSGNLLGDIDGTGTPAGSFGAAGLAVDSTGTLYVADPSHAVVDVFGAFTTPPPTHDVTVTKSGAGSGTVTSSPAGINCGATCTAPFDENTTPQLTATPAANNTFTGWTVDGSTSTCPDTGPGVSTCDIAIGTGDHTVVANFAPVKHTLTVTKAGAGSGLVTSTPSGISCDPTCSALFNHNQAVTLTAAPAANSTFTGWSGSGATGCTGVSPCVVTMSADKAVTATFALKAPTVTTTAGATGIAQHTATVAGTVNPNSNNVTDCHIEYGTTTSYGSQAPCAASPGAGASAVGVSAALSGLTASTTYHFRVVATSAGGTTNGGDQTFATLADTCATNTALCPPPPPPPGCDTDPSLCLPGVLTLAATTATISGGNAPVKLSCKGDKACTGTVTLTAKVKVRKGKKTVTKTLTLGKASVNVAAGGSATVKIALSRAARNLLAKKPSLKATITGPNTLKHTIVLKAQKKKKKKK